MRLTQSIHVLFVLLWLFAQPISAQTLMDRSRQFELSRQIWTNYVRPLALTGKSGRDAMAIMMAERFSCAFRNMTPDWPNVPPQLYCHRRPSGFSELCPLLSVIISFSDRKKIPEQAAFVNQLREENVAGFSSLCYYTPTAVAMSFFTNQKNAEADLARHTLALGLVQKTAQTAIDSLLIDEYFCGLETDDKDSQFLPGPAKILCHRVSLRSEKRPQTKHCFEERVWLSVGWTSPNADKPTLLREMETVPVTSVESGCWFPGLRGDGPVIQGEAFPRTGV